LIYLILWSLTRQRVAALSASFLFAFSYYFWTQAVVAEVYTLHTLLMASLLLLLLRWEATRSDGLLVAFGLLYGLSFGNHMSTILLAPGFALFLFAVDGRALLRPRQLLLLLLPFLAGLGVYLYLPVRYQAQPAFNYVGRYDAQGNFIALDLRQPGNLWWLVSGKAFRGLMFDYTPAELVKEVGQAAYRLWGNYLGIGLVPGLMGAWVQMRKKPRHFALFGVLFAANLVFFINYRVVDKAVMFVPAYLVWAVWIGEGFNWLVRWVQGPHRTGSPPPVWAWGLLVMVIVPLVVNWPLVNVHDDTRARDLADAALMHASRDAIILGWWTSVPPIQYLQLVENRRPDLLVINRFLIGADEMYALIDHSLGNRPVYVMELDEGLAKAYQPVSLGPMYELAPRRLAEANP
jgi:4-amino-4-deoxy-L-arabinose transferase-like glycosyltransferase